MKHIKALDTLRALAVFTVIIQHWGLPIDGQPGAVARFIQCFFIPDGGAGVFLFFVLSGFLITSILLNARIENPGNKERMTAAKNFIVRRALRIFPIYYLTIFILYCFFPDIKPNLFYLLTYTLNIVCYRSNDFVSSFAHSWSLSVEEQFYIFWPWFILFINSKYLKYVFIIAILTGVCSTIFTMGFLGSRAPYLVFNCMDAFGIGGLYAWMRLDKNNCARFEKAIKMIARSACWCMFTGK